MSADNEVLTSESPLGFKHVIVCASQAAARQHPKRGAPHTWCTTFVELTRAFAGPALNAAGVQPRSIDLQSARLLLRQVRSSARGASIAKYDEQQFAAVRDLLRGLMQLRAAGIAAPHRQQLQEPSAAVVALFDDLERYENALQHLLLADTADVQRGALLRAATCAWPASLADLSSVTIEPGIEVFDLRRDVLRVMASRGVNVTVSLNYSVSQPKTTPWAEAMLHGFEAQKTSAVQLRFALQSVDNTNSALGDRLLWSVTEGSTQKNVSPVPKDAFGVLCVRPGHDLTALVVRQVHQLLQRGAAPQEIAVVLVANAAAPGTLDVDTWAKKFARALAATGVACRVPTGPPLTQTRAGRLILSLLQVAEELAAALPTQGDELFVERGISIFLWARCLAAEPHAQENDLAAMSPHGHAQLLRRCGDRRLGPVGLRRALRSLRGVANEVADAAIEAALRWLTAWVLPLTCGPRPLHEHLLPLIAYADHLQLDDGRGHQSCKDDVIAALLRLQRAAKAFPCDMTLHEAHSWVRGVLGEERSASAHANPPTASVSIVTGQDALGLKIPHVLAIGLNGGLTRDDMGPLSEAVRREINQAIGYKLLQQGAVSGRAPLPQGAKEQFYFYELLRSCQKSFMGVVLQLQDEDLNCLTPDLQRLVDRHQVTVLEDAALPRTPWYAQPSQKLIIDNMIFSSALPWAVEQATQPSARALCELLQQRIARGAPHDDMGPRMLSALHRQQVESHILGQTVGVSAMDTLATCRYRYFASGLLGLSREPHPEHFIDRRRAGEAAHRALFQIYSDLLQIAPWSHWRACSQQALVRAQAFFGAQQSAILPRAWLHDDLRDGALLSVWHIVTSQLHRDLAPGAHEPMVLEYRFGDPMQSSRPALVVPHPEGRYQPLRVRGSIDRVDGGAAQLRVIDYKSSLPTREPDRHVQLGLYQAVALRDVAFTMGSRERPNAMGASWQLLGHSQSGPSMRSPKELQGTPESIVARTFAALWARVDGLLSGDVRPDPAPESSCRHCDFLALCRHRSEHDPADDSPQADDEQVEAAS